MAKYRKKPAVIEAFRYDGDLMDRDGCFYVPEWAIKAFEDGVIKFKDAGEMYVGYEFKRGKLGRDYYEIEFKG